MSARKSSDLGAALSGLVLGGSTIFLLLLLVVWLTNLSAAGKAGHETPGGAATHAPAVAPSPSAIGTTPAAQSGVPAAATPPPSAPAH